MAVDCVVRARPVDAELLRDAEIQDLQDRGSVGPARDEEVFWLEVAMNDTERVRLREALAGFEQHVDRFADRERRVARGEKIVEVAALEVLEHDERSPGVGAAEIEHAHDVVAAQARRGASLVVGAFADQPLVGQVLAYDLDRHRAVEVELRRFPDDAHPSDADELLDSVLVGEGGAGADPG